MINRAILLVTASVLIIALGCAASRYIPGTGGKSSARKIEKTGHLPTPDGVTCYVCHKRDVPEQELHRKFGRECSECHVKTTWMASKYPHTKWPLNENHYTRCTFCHTRLGLFDFEYQCWGCHHKKEETRKFHSDKGISDIEACIKCHKNIAKK